MGAGAYILIRFGVSLMIPSLNQFKVSPEGLFFPAVSRLSGLQRITSAALGGRSRRADTRLTEPQLLTPGFRD